MKKFLVLLFLMVIGTSVYAQKRYLIVEYYYVTGNSDSYVNLSGCIPTDMESSYTNASWGGIIDELAQRGYIIEQFSNTGYSYNHYSNSNERRGIIRETVIMSISSTSPSGQTELVGDVNNDSEVTIADINQLVDIILGLVKANPSLLEQVK